MHHKRRLMPWNVKSIRLIDTVGFDPGVIPRTYWDEPVAADGSD